MRSRSLFERTLVVPVLFHGIDVATRLRAVGELAALSLQETFFDMGRQGLAFFVSPAFLGILSLQRTTEYVFRVRIAAAGKPFVD